MSGSTLQGSSLPPMYRNNPEIQQQVRQVQSTLACNQEMVSGVVDIFYNINVRDERVNLFFSGVDMGRLRRMLVKYLMHVLGGEEYNGKSMRAAHRHLLDITDAHYDAILENLSRAFLLYGCSQSYTERVIAVAETLRDDVIGR
ncbi:hypothetical protein H4219_005076 [Mycoemilia scoparia]|uniref:Uncharacterized protein n=1 Tax=Mycoemilia scoparia TaxID=417184 RepID=A0A9W7ZW13_9FUNG|nr:hypothetical protein H4219_005076 [Mycoemilia scoparia]